jgi:hypothetical protein
MSRLFESTSLNGMILANRTIRSATWEGLAGNDGSSTSRLTELLAELARGGIGLIITSHAYVSPEGQAGPWQLGIYSDDMIPGLVEMTGSIQATRGKICLHGKVERSHATDGIEFCQLLTYTGDVGLIKQLSEWEDYSNFHRPHGALRGQTPYEVLREKLKNRISLSTEA